MKTFGKISLAVALCAMGIGIVILIISFTVIQGNGGVSKDFTYHMQDTVSGVDSIEIDINYGEVILEEGTEFSIRVEHMMEDSFDSDVVNGVWRIKNDLDNRNSINIFGWSIPISIFGNGIFNDYSPDVYITLPKGFVSKQLRISVDAGTLEADKLNSERAYLQVGAGSMEIRKFSATNSSSYQVGAGELIINDLTAHNIEMDCGIGSIFINGVITGNSFIETGIGRIELDLYGNEEDYNYDLECGIGGISLNDRSYGGLGTESSVHHTNAENSFDLNCGIGEINISIK